MVLWPFDQGTPDVGMGAGAARIAGDGELHERLARAGWRPTVQRVTAGAVGAPEVARTFDTLRQLALDVRGAVARGAFPLVLAGGCLSAAATVAGAATGTQAPGVVWLDAHADLDDPEDNASGFLDVMALSVLTGACWRTQRASIPGFVAVPEHQIALLGVRDLADYQRGRLARSAVHARAGAWTTAERDSALAALPATVYLHIDLDVLDAGVAAVNRHAAPGGPSLAVVLDTIDAVFARKRVIAAALTAYEPAADPRGLALDPILAIAERIAVRARAAAA